MTSAPNEMGAEFQPAPHRSYDYVLQHTRGGTTVRFSRVKKLEIVSKKKRPTLKAPDPFADYDPRQARACYVENLFDRSLFQPARFGAA